MLTFKSIVNKIFCYAGMTVLLLCFLCTFWNGTFPLMNGSIVLFALSVLLVTVAAVKCMHLYTSAEPQKLPDVRNSSVLIHIAVIAFFSVLVRGFTFILTDSNLLSGSAAAVYFSAAVNTILIYCIATRIWRHSCGMVAAIVYCVWSDCEVLAAAHSESLGISLPRAFAAQSAALFALLFLYLSVSTRGHNTSLFCCVVSGLAAGTAVSFDYIYLILILCAATYFLVSDTRIRRKKIWQRRPYAIGKSTFISLYAVTALLAFAVWKLLLYFAFKVPLISFREQFSLISHNSLHSFFDGTDAAFMSAVPVMLFARNYFSNYIQLLILAVLLVLGIFGAFVSARKNDMRSMVLAEFISLSVILSVLFGVFPRVYVGILPFVLLLSVGGMHSAGEFSMILKKVYSGRHKRIRSEKAEASETAESGGGSVPAQKEPPYGEAALVDQTIETEPVLNETAEEEDYFITFSTESASVASGEDQQSLLQSLVDTKENDK